MKSYSLRADEELFDQFDDALGDRKRIDVLREYMKATVDRGAVLTEITDDEAASSASSGVTNDDLLMAIQRHGSAGSASRRTQQTQKTKIGNDVSLDALHDYQAPTDVPDDLTPHGKSNVLSIDALKLWKKNYEDTGDAPLLNPQHVDPDHRPQGVGHAVALALGVIRYRDRKRWIKQKLLDVIDTDLGYTRNYAKSNGFVDALVEEMTEDPYDTGRYVYGFDGVHYLEQKALSRFESQVDAVKQLENVDDWRLAVSTLSTRQDILKDLGVDVTWNGMSIDEYCDEVRDEGRENIKDSQEDSISAAISELEALADEGSEFESIADAAAAKKDARSKVSTVESAVDMIEWIGSGLDADYLTRAQGLRDDVVEVADAYIEQQLDEVRDRGRERVQAVYDAVSRVFSDEEITSSDLIDDAVSDFEEWRESLHSEIEDDVDIDVDMAPVGFAKYEIHNRKMQIRQEEKRSDALAAANRVVDAVEDMDVDSVSDLEDLRDEKVEVDLNPAIAEYGVMYRSLSLLDDPESVRREVAAALESLECELADQVGEDRFEVVTDKRRGSSKKEVKIDAIRRDMDDVSDSE